MLHWLMTVNAQTWVTHVGLLWGGCGGRDREHTTIAHTPSYNNIVPRPI